MKAFRSTSTSNDFRRARHGVAKRQAIRCVLARHRAQAGGVMEAKKISADDDLETRIQREYERVCRAPTPDERTAAWSEFVRLVNSRSPERVAEMEAERGLR